MARWTVATLYLHFTTLLVERDRRIDSRFDDAETATRAALAAAEKAVNKAELSADRRFDAQNEFREQLKDQAATFITRTEAEQAIERNAKDIAGLSLRVNAIVNERQGAAGVGRMLAVIMGLILTGIAIIVTAILATR